MTPPSPPTDLLTADEHAQAAGQLLTFDGYVDDWPGYEIATLNALQGIAHALLALRTPVTNAPIQPPTACPGDQATSVTLLGVGDIADLLGVSRPRVWQLRKHPGFPKPDGRHGRSAYWAEPAIRAWAAAVGRQVIEPSNPTKSEEGSEP